MKDSRVIMSVGEPVYGTISRNGHVYAVEYKIWKDEYGYKKTATGGYDASIFEGCPNDMPILDFRTADEQKVFTLLINSNWFIKETDIPLDPETRQEISAQDYLNTYADKTGATLTAVSEIKKELI